MTATQPELAQPGFVTRQELATLILELRADRAEMRLDAAAMRQEMRDGFAAVDKRFEKVEVTLATVIDSLADLRNEYHQHTHG